MQQANNLFILSQVADHVLASVANAAGTVKIIMCHRDNDCINRLQLNIDRAGKDYVISYDALYHGSRIKQPKSKPIPADLVQEFIGKIANDTLPENFK